jgi:hypothetical protein
VRAYGGGTRRESIELTCSQSIDVRRELRMNGCARRGIFIKVVGIPRSYGDLFEDIAQVCFMMEIRTRQRRCVVPSKTYGAGLELLVPNHKDEIVHAELSVADPSVGGGR